jgi:hypothetical protein
MFLVQERRVVLFLFLLVGRFIFGGFLYEERNIA